MNQMKKTLLTLAGLLLVAGGVGLFAWKGVYETDEKSAQKKAAEERLFATGEGARDGGPKSLEFVKLTVTTGDETTVLERTPGAPWRITAPVSASVDPLVIDGLVSQLQTAKFKTTLEGEATDAELKTYGLSPPAFSVEASAVVDGQERTVSLSGGIENPFDGTIYMRKGDSRTVHMAEGGVRWSLAKTTFDLRNKALFSVDEAAIKRVALKSRTNDWELARGDDKLWRLTRPEPVLADAVTVAAVLGGLRGERATEFPGEPTPERLASLGFNAPLAKATLTLEEGTVTLTLATPSADGGAPYYGLREDADGKVLAAVNASALPAFDRNAMELRDRSLLPFAKAAVTRIALAAPGAPLVVIERDPGSASAEAWKVTAPTSGRARAYRVATTLWALGALKGGAVVVEKPDAKVLETYGLDAKQARTVTLSGADGAELAVLTLGKELVGKAGSSYALGTRRAIVEIDSSRLNELPWKADDVLEAAGDAGP